MDEEVTMFMAITGENNEVVARGFLDISGGEPMQAVQLYFDSPELRASFTTPTPAPAPPPAASASTARASTRAAGRQDAQGIIHIDSDDEDDIPISQAYGDDDNDMIIPDDENEDEDIAAVARAAQEEEDAAMARKLQDDMYSQDAGSVDGVRAPIARTTETLVGGDNAWNSDDREAAVLEQLRRRRQPAGPGPGPSRNPFSQSIWDDPLVPGAGAPPVPMGTRPGVPPQPSEHQVRAQRLADMFRPPFDVMTHLSWDDARQEGKEGKKWILVNVQDMSIFQCQELNRDHWKDEGIKALVREHFIFLQYDKNEPRCMEYINFYFGQGYEVSDNYPYVSIIDPRTGEQVKTWSGLPFPTQKELYADLVEFLDRYSLAANSKNPVSTSKPKAKPVDPDRMTEEEQLEMALKNSLAANGGLSGPSLQDPDELTKGKGKEAAVKEAEPAGLVSTFSQISSSNPHSEPAIDPTTSTRIQFRHPAGRVIRRFACTDPVRRIYEWLKAEPLEGKEGVTFELKAQPGGELIEKLDMTIAEAGLKQGTVMIEFVEDD